MEMKLAVLMKNKDNGNLASYKIYDNELETLQAKVKEYNEAGHTTEAIIVNDKLMVEALDLKESTETVKSVVKNMVEEFEDLKRTVANTIDSLGYMVNNVKDKIKELGNVS
jgi:hypothetical protein